MAAVFNAASNSGAKNNTNNWTWTHLCSGNNRLLIVSVSWFTTSGYTISSVTYNGVSMTQGSYHYYGGPSVAIYYLVAPASGSHNVVVAFGGNVWGAAGAVSLTSAAQVSPVRSSGYASNGNITSITTPIMNVVAGDFVVDSFFGGESISGVSPAAGQTQQFLIQSSRIHSLGQSTKAITATGGATMGWQRPGNPMDMIIDAVAFKGASPEINIKQGSTSIASGGEYDFSLVALGEDKSVTFMIENNGDAYLYLTGAPLVAVSGADSDEFEVTAQPTSPIAAGSSVTFVVMFTPDSKTEKSVLLTISNDDANESTYTVNVYGEGGDIITIGHAAIDRQTMVNPGYSSTILRSKMANGPGYIRTVEFYVGGIVHADCDFYVGIFYQTGSNTYRCRAAANLGHPSLGLNTIGDLELEAEVSDFIGYWWGDNESMSAAGYIDIAGYDPESSGVCTNPVGEQKNHCIVDDEAVFNFYALSPQLITSIGGSGAGYLPASAPLYLGGISAAKAMTRLRGF